MIVPEGLLAEEAVFLYSEGEEPKCRLKALENVKVSLYPTFDAIMFTLVVSSESMRAAIFILYVRRYS